MPINTATTLHLNPEQVHALDDLLHSALASMSHEIAATDSPRFRAELVRRRDALRTVEQALQSPSTIGASPTSG